MSTQPPLIVHAIHHLFIGGLENGLINLINRIDEREFRHAILCMDDYSSEFAKRIQRDDVEIVPLHKKKGNGIWLYPKIMRVLRRLAPDILHSRSPSAMDTLVPAALAGVPARVHGEHGWDELDRGGQNRKNQMLRRLHRPFVHHYITVSRDIEQYLHTRIGVPEERITQIYNGVDTERFQPATSAPDADLPEWISPGKHFVIGTVGRLQPVKAQADLLRALALLLEKHPVWRERVRLMIIGGGPLLDSLRTQAAEAGLTDVVWMPGARADIPELMQAMDLFALPSIAEGVSNTILEAMATGLPVVASRVGGNAELVVDGSSGVLVSPEQPHEIAQVFGRFFRDEAFTRTLGQAARERALREFSLEKMVERYLAVYRRALAGFG